MDYSMVLDFGVMSQQIFSGDVEAVVNGLPNVFPICHTDEGSLAGELKKLVGELINWLTNMDTWQIPIFVPVAMDFAFSPLISSSME